MEQFAVQELPRLIIVDSNGQVTVGDGASRISSDPAGRDFPWMDELAAPTLSETELMVRLGPAPPEPGQSGLKGIFINSKNYVALGLVDEAEENDDIPFSGMKLRPYVEVSKQTAQDEIRRMGFASDFHPHQKDIDKFPGTELLLIFDPDRAYGEKLVFPVTQAAYEREKGRLEEAKERITEEFQKSLMPQGGADSEDLDEEPEENVIVRDLPKECKEWTSETMDVTQHEVTNFTVHNSRPPMQVMISRSRAQFGKNNFKFSDSSGENVHNCRPQKDPNFVLQRKELDIGIQSVKDMRTCACQTTWYRPVNKSTQYSPNDFLQRNKVDNKIDELSEFLTSVSNSVEEALQTNETVDIFQEEFKNLGDEEAGAVSKTHSNMKEHRNFHDVTYTKGKRIEWVEWVPNSTDMIACAYCENLPFSERVESQGKATLSTILLWSFQDTLRPHAILFAPWEVTTFKFYPSDEKYLIGGMYSGQLAVWKLSDADLGYALREKSKGGNAEEEKSSSIPTVFHKQISMIDESHKRPVLGLEFLPPELEIEKRGRVAKWEVSRDATVKYFLTIAGDGQVMIWDFQALLDGINDNDFVWRPVHRIQLQRQDSGTEMGCCHILYCRNRYDDKGNRQLTNFFASTEEGELIFGDWAARVEEDRKPEFCKKMFTISKTFRPMLSLERSKFFPDILLGVTDWAFYLWKDGVHEHLFQSSYTSTYFTRGIWSPTRPSVIFLGLMSGGIDIWDFSDQSHKASLSDSGASMPISSMAFLTHGDSTDQLLAVGTASGHLHVHMIPKNLVRQAGKELDNMRKFLDREEHRVTYFRERRQQLGDLKEQMEKQAQMAADKDEVDKAKTTAEDDKMDAAAEEAYQKLEQECLELLKS